MKKNIRIAIGLSGGVDSSVAAAFLVQAGYDVTAVFLKTYENQEGLVGGCPWEEDLSFAQRVASQLSIPLVVWNYEREYERIVLRYFTEELAFGRTPNPDILCNSVIKFGVCLDRAIEEKFDFFATGHYARTICHLDKKVDLLRGVDKTKDQSYFLSNLSQKQLRHTMFPIGDLTKKNVRQYAQALQLATATRKDSQGICFIGKVDYASFVHSRLPNTVGVIQDPHGSILGKHSGCHYFTIGQRYGLHIGGLKEPLYVYAKDYKRQILYVCNATDPHLVSSDCAVSKIHWIKPPTTFPFSCEAQVRYRQPAITAHVEEVANGYSIHFQNPVRAVAPGQWVVLYNGDQCLGSGRIENTTRVA